MPFISSVRSTFGPTNFKGTPIQVVASGGIVSDSGIYRLHRFTGSGSLVVGANPMGRTFEVVVVGGGASGGSTSSENRDASGGGGAGGLFYHTFTPPNSGGSYSISIGSGGSGVDGTSIKGNNGTATTMVVPTGTISATGGGAGGTSSQLANNGGSGGGQGGPNTTPTTSSPGTGPGTGYAFAGGIGRADYFHLAGGGGGAGGVGVSATPGSYYDERRGGLGRSYFGFDIAGGGSAGDNYMASASIGFGGGRGRVGTFNTDQNGTNNTGGGGGGGRRCASGSGGSGVVIVRYIL